MSEDANNADEIRIKALLETWADAVRRHNITAILAHHEPDMVMFDLPPPLQCKGIKAYKETWGPFFRYHKPGTAFDIQELAVTAGQDVAFAVAIMRCGPNSSSNPADKDGFMCDWPSSNNRKNAGKARGHRVTCRASTSPLRRLPRLDRTAGEAPWVPAAVEQFGEPSRQRQGHAARSASRASTPKFSCMRADRASM
jgi:ketosteroid isomerase-like protein